MAKSDQRRVAIIDGSNVAHAGEKHTHLQNITHVCSKLTEERYKPIAVVDAALRHNIDDGENFERMVDDGRIKQAPAGTDADYFILSFARELNGYVVSNDRFREHAGEFGDVLGRVIRYMIVDNEVVLKPH